MGLSRGDLPVRGIGRGLVAVLLNEFQLRKVEDLAVVQVLFPVFAEIREQRRGFPEFDIALDPIGRQLRDQRFDLLAQGFFPAGDTAVAVSAVLSGAEAGAVGAASSGACDWAHPGEAPISAANASAATTVPIPTIRMDFIAMVSIAELATSVSIKEATRPQDTAAAPRRDCGRLQAYLSKPSIVRAPARPDGSGRDPQPWRW